jgi:hypothetical protein
MYCTKKRRRGGGLAAKVNESICTVVLVGVKELIIQRADNTGHNMYRQALLN